MSKLKHISKILDVEENINVDELLSELTSKDILYLIYAHGNGHRTFIFNVQNFASRQPQKVQIQNSG